MNIKEKIRKLQNGKEEEKSKFLWFGVAFFMLVFFLAWIWNLNINLRRMSKVDFDFTLPDVPENISEDKIGEIVASGQDAIGELEDSFNDDLWTGRAEEYLNEKNFFADEEFSELRLSSVQKNDDFVVVKYEQYYKSLPVINGDLMLSYDMNGNLSQVDNRLKTGIEIDIEPSVSAQKAKEMALYYLNDSNYVFENSNLAVVSFQDKYYLVWDLFFDVSDKEAKSEIFIGAKNGTIILPEELDK